MKITTHLICLILILLVAACMPIGESPVVTITPGLATITATVTESAPLITETPTLDADPGLTVQKLRNSVFLAPNSQKTIQLTEGDFSTTDESGMFSVMMLPQIAIGDLNADQIDDAVVLLAESSGGTGVFVSMVVIVSQGGAFIQLGSVAIDDRPIINNLTIMDGAITLEAVIHGINDAMATPTLDVKQTYRIYDNQITLINLASAFQSGTERSIFIDAPLENSEISSPVRITGSMPVGPFENNLKFGIYDLAGNSLYEAGFMVAAADMGAPATFENEIVLPSLASGSWVRLELADLSMADGSLIAMYSVIVRIK